MAQVALLGGVSCKVRSLPNGAVGEVLTMLPSGEPGWGAGGPGGGSVDLCALDATQADCVAGAVRGDEVLDAFGVLQGYFVRAL